MSFLRDLRRSYPTIQTSQFISIYEQNRDADNLLELLDAAEAEAMELKTAEKHAMAELVKSLSVSEQHSRLHFMVSADVDLVHAQAIIMYGFLNPGSQHPYIGKRILHETNLRQNTANKLGRQYSKAKYDVALDYLGRQGVVLVTRSEGKSGEAYSLNPNHNRGHGASEHGAQIIKVALAYLHHK